MKLQFELMTVATRERKKENSRVVHNVEQKVNISGFERNMKRLGVGNDDGMDDGEMFLEYRQSESFSFDDGRLKAASYDTDQGFGLRAVSDESTGYAHAAELSEDAIMRAVSTVQAVRVGAAGTAAA